MALIPFDVQPRDTIEIPTQAKKQMIKVSREPGKTRVWINSSSLSIIQQCLQKANMSLFRGLGGGGSPATLFGTAIHSAMEEFYRGTIAERVMPRNLAENLELMGSGEVLVQENDYLLYRAARAFIDKASPLHVLPPTDARSIPNGLWILFHYFTTYIDDPYEIMCDEDGPMVERLLEHSIYNEGELEIILFGTIDAILKNPRSNQILITDHKTSSVVGKDFYNRLKPNHQYTAYIKLAQECLNLETEDFMVNCIQVKKRPSTARGTAPHFPRQITKRTVDDIADFTKMLKYFVTQYLYCCEIDYWPKGDVNACSMYGGCQYLDICSAPNNIKENIISARYEESK